MATGYINRAPTPSRPAYGQRLATPWRHYVSPSRRMARAMSLHLAVAVVVFALIQVVCITLAVDRGMPPQLAYIGLAVVVAIAVPAAHRRERIWSGLGQDALPSPGLSHRFHRDVRRVWALSLLGPVAWTAIAALLVVATRAA